MTTVLDNLIMEKLTTIQETLTDFTIKYEFSDEHDSCWGCTGSCEGGCDGGCSSVCFDSSR